MADMSTDAGASGAGDSGVPGLRYWDNGDGTWTYHKPGEATMTTNQPPEKLGFPRSGATAGPADNGQDMNLEGQGPTGSEIKFFDNKDGTWTYKHPDGTVVTTPMKPEHLGLDRRMAETSAAGVQPQDSGGSLVGPGAVSTSSDGKPRDSGGSLVGPGAVEEHDESGPRVALDYLKDKIAGRSTDTSPGVGHGSGIAGAVFGGVPKLVNQAADAEPQDEDDQPDVPEKELDRATAARDKYDPYVQTAAKKYGVSPGLVHSVIKQESNYNEKAVGEPVFVRNPDGSIKTDEDGEPVTENALGLMQLLPSAHPGASLNPKQNIDQGTKYLREGLDVGASKGLSGADQTRYAAAYYYGGPRAAEKFRTQDSGASVPQPTASDVRMPSINDYAKGIAPGGASPATATGASGAVSAQNTSAPSGEPGAGAGDTSGSGPGSAPASTDYLGMLRAGMGGVQQNMFQHQGVGDMPNAGAPSPETQAAMAQHPTAASAGDTIGTLAATGNAILNPAAGARAIMPQALGGNVTASGTPSTLTPQQQAAQAAPPQPSPEASGAGGAAQTNPAGEDQAPTTTPQPDVMGDVNQAAGEQAQTDVQNQAISAQEVADAQAAQQKGIGNFERIAGTLQENRAFQQWGMQKAAFEEADRRIADLDAKSKSLWQAADVDPNRLWHHMDTGDKVLAGLGLIVSGLGAGLGGQGGPVNLISQNIERDVRAQESTFNNRKHALIEDRSIYDQYMSTFNSKKIAFEGTTAQLLQATASKLQAYVATSNSPIIRAQGEQAAQQIMASAQQHTLAMQALARQNMYDTAVQQMTLGQYGRMGGPPMPGYTRIQLKGSFVPVPQNSRLITALPAAESLFRSLSKWKVEVARNPWLYSSANLSPESQKARATMESDLRSTYSDAFSQVGGVERPPQEVDQIVKSFMGGISPVTHPEAFGAMQGTTDAVLGRLNPLLHEAGLPDYDKIQPGQGGSMGTYLPKPAARKQDRVK